MYGQSKEGGGRRLARMRRCNSYSYSLLATAPFSEASSRVPAPRSLLEICVDSLDGLNAAIDGGADRIELCAALSVGGLTPSPALAHAALKSPIPVYAMVRPRPGDFVFSEGEVVQMEREIAQFVEAGLAGVVIGASQPGGELDVGVLKRLTNAVGGIGTTLHRAFDLTPDPFIALEQAVDLEINRILTSGQASAAPLGAELIREMQKRAGGRIAIMAGAGVTPQNVGELVRKTGVSEVHGSASRIQRPGHPDSLGFGTNAPIKTTDAQTVRRLKTELGNALTRAG